MATVLAAIPLAGVPLDSDQQKACDHRKGTAAVAASAGSGKTSLLVARAVALVASGEDPAGILTLVFNTNAQATLRERLGANPATKGHEKGMASTFHAFSLQMCLLMKPDLQVLGLNAEEDAMLESKGSSTFQRGAGVPRQTAYDLGKAIWRDMGGDDYSQMRPEIVKGTDLVEVMKYETAARERLFSAGWPNAFFYPLSAKDAQGRSIAGQSSPEHKAKLRSALEALQMKDLTKDTLIALVEFMPRFRQARMAVNGGQGAVDFTDMLLGLGNFIRKETSPDFKGERKVMTRLGRIKHLQVDEAQDGNELRWYITQAIANLGATSVMTVGDLRQSIAGFAGAQPQLFRAWWDKADKQFALPNNYRSAAAIVAAGNAVAKGEPWNVGGDAIAARADLGMGSVRVEGVGTLGIAVEISTAIASGLGHKDVTVLARTKAALEQVAFGLRTKGLKVYVRGGGHVWKSMDGRKVRAYLDFGDGVLRDKQATGLALNSPKRYVKPALLQGSEVNRGVVVGPWFKEGRINLSKLQGENYLPSKAVVQAYRTLSNLSWEDRVQQVEDWLLEGLAADAKENEQAPGDKSDKADLIKSLCEIARVCGSVANLDAAIEAEIKLDPNDPDVIELSTIHRAKGDQWQVVYVTGVQEGTFPHIKATDDESFAEEVRLLYVAVTRPVTTLVVDVGSNVDRFAAKLAALSAVAASSAPPPPASPPRQPKRATEPSSEPLVAFTEPVIDAGVMTQTFTPAELQAAIEADSDRAERLTFEGTKPVEGERFVVVRWDELLTLLTPHGFAEDVTMARRMNQRVLAATLKDGAEVMIYTSVPPGGQAARALGEDSIKVVLMNPEGRPYGRRQPYAARTRNWRTTLLSRIVEALQAHPDLKASAA